MSEPVSPADTIRRFIAEREYGTDDGGTVWTLDADEARAALDALLAVGERDKAEIGRLRRLVARAAVKREVLLIEGERYRRKIAQLTEALAFYADEDNYFETYPDETQCPVQCPALADEGARARAAVLADEDEGALSEPGKVDSALLTPDEPTAGTTADARHEAVTPGSENASTDKENARPAVAHSSLCALNATGHRGPCTCGAAGEENT